MENNNSGIKKIGDNILKIVMEILDYLLFFVMLLLIYPFLFIYYCIEGLYSIYRDRTICNKCNKWIIWNNHHKCRKKKIKIDYNFLGIDKKLLGKYAKKEYEIEKKELLKLINKNHRNNSDISVFTTNKEYEKSKSKYNYFENEIKFDEIANAKSTKEIYDFFIKVGPILRIICCNFGNLSKKHLGTRDLEPLAQKAHDSLKDCIMAFEEIHFIIHPNGKLVD